MAYRLGTTSKRRLKGVHPRIVSVINHALIYTEQDFSVVEGVRLMKTQEEYVARGVSRTLNSKHLVQKDGFGHAVDLVPWVAGGLRWELEPCLPVAEAVRRAAFALGVRIRWGGAWRVLGRGEEDVGKMVEDYIDARRAAGKRPFIDAFHYELLT